jgi:hypothetical protein
MELTLIRARRTKEQNQERAYIAAARRRDRPFKQRLESLQNASELHFARTGRRFRLTVDQLWNTGPLEEIERGNRRALQEQRFAHHPPPSFLPEAGSQDIFINTDDMANVPSSGLQHQERVIDLFRHGFSPFQQQGGTSRGPQVLRNFAQDQQASMLSPLEEHELRPLGANSFNRGYTDADRASTEHQMETIHSHSALPPFFFELDQSQGEQRQSPEMNEEDVRNFIDEYLLRSSLGSSTPSTSGQVQQDASAKPLLEEPGLFIETPLEAFQGDDGVVDGELEVENMTNSEEWEIGCMLNDDGDDGDDHDHENATSPPSS